MKNPKIQIKNRKVGLDYKPLVVAELGINHEGCLKTAFEMVDSAKRAGIEVIKHQTHIVDDEMSNEARNIVPGNSNLSIYEIMDRCSLTEEEEYKLMKYVEDKGMIFISTPFSRAAADRLKSFNVPAYKIGSGECNNYPLLEHVAEFGKPVILSTGMNNLKSVRKAVSIFDKKNVSVAILHTTNLYPTPPNLVRLGAMIEISKVFPNNVFGLSDHTLNNAACLGAVALGASILERHFTDKMSRKGPDIVCSMDEKNAMELVKQSKELFLMRGGKKEAATEEKITSDFAFSSVCSIKNINKDEVLSSENIWVKRPGTGEILAEYYDSVVGKKAANDIPIDTMLKWNDIN